jgi:hypothetical protein
MGLADRFRDRASSALGGMLGYAGAVAVDTLDKASSRATADKGPTPYPPTSIVEVPDDDPMALFADPFALIDQLGYKDKPTGLTFYTLDEMARRVPYFMAYMQTRINQVANFANAQEHEREPGFQIVLRDRDKKATKAEIKRAKEIEDLILTTGATRSYEKDSFEEFVRKFVRDSLTYDQGAFEVVYNRGGKPADFYAVDAATVRIADVPLGANIEDDPSRVRYVQVYDETVIAEFASHQLAFCVRNPRTGIRINGYGFSELEMLINVVTAMLWTYEYNKRFFSQGSVTKGLLNIRGGMTDKKLKAFRRQWYQQITGVINSWRTPVLNADELQYIDLHSSNREMEWSAWNDFNIKLLSGVCQFDPAEANFVFGNTGQTTQMFQAPAEQRIKSSKDRGLLPILRSLAGWLNEYFVWPLEPEFCLKFTGMDPRNSDMIIAAEKQQVSYLKTVDEIRAEHDMEPLSDDRGDIILDPTFLQHVQAKEQAKMMEQGGFGDEGPEDQGPEDRGGENGENRSSGNSEWDALMSGMSKVSPDGDKAEAEKSSGWTIYDLEL